VAPGEGLAGLGCAQARHGSYYRGTSWAAFPCASRCLRPAVARARRDTPNDELAIDDEAQELAVEDPAGLVPTLVLLDGADVPTACTRGPGGQIRPYKRPLVPPSRRSDRRKRRVTGPTARSSGS